MKKYFTVAKKKAVKRLHNFYELLYTFYICQTIGML